MYRVVSVSRNTSLLIGRNDALGMAGFTVLSPRFLEEAPALALQRRADAVVIGDSVPANERAVLIAQFRKRCPGCLVVFVYARAGEKEHLADLSVDVTGGPEALIIALGEKLGRSRDLAA